MYSQNLSNRNGRNAWVLPRDSKGYGSTTVYPPQPIIYATSHKNDLVYTINLIRSDPRLRHMRVILSAMAATLQVLYARNNVCLKLRHTTATRP